MARVESDNVSKCGMGSLKHRGYRIQCPGCTSDFTLTGDATKSATRISLIKGGWGEKKISGITVLICPVCMSNGVFEKEEA